MKALVAILFAMMLAATYAGGPVAAFDSEALSSSSCCGVCSCCVEEAPAGPLSASPAAPAGISGSVRELALAPRLVLLRVIALESEPSDFRLSADAEAPASVGAVALFERDCALLI